MTDSNKAKDYESRTPDSTTEYAATQADEFSQVCSVPEVIPEVFPSSVSPGRLELLVESFKKWVNGTTLRYYFFNEDTDGRIVGGGPFRPWKTTEQEKDVVRSAFKRWKDVGIGLNFQEVNSRDEAEIRIGFERGDGAWSYVGRDIIDLVPGRNERTMNFGWDLTRAPKEIDTAVHEIGHTLGFDHEHQNPTGGIVWDEEAVYAALAAPPNRWSREKTLFNIIRKIAPDTVQGSEWDPNSIMHYPFGPGLVRLPEQYRTTGIHPAGGLSARDLLWVKRFYPGQGEAEVEQQMKIAESIKLLLSPGEQKNFSIVPSATRNYEIGTFGTSDTVMVLFEDNNSEMRYLTGDDDGGEDRNAHIKIKLQSGRKYVLRLRLYYAEREDETSVMVW
jgi:hypothetical protein